MKLRDQTGATFVEYTLLVCLLCMTATMGVAQVGGKASGAFNDAAASIKAANDGGGTYGTNPVPKDPDPPPLPPRPPRPPGPWDVPPPPQPQPQPPKG